jgi:molybdate transport system substrate-binding protein
MVFYAVAAQSATVTVFAAASLRGALDKIGASWEAETGDTVVVSYAGSGTLARQIMAGAPADIFISANDAWMVALEDAGLVQSNTRLNLVRNRLVLVAGAESDVTFPVDIAKLAGQGPVAMGLVQSVPAGIYGKQALSALGLWEAWAPHIAQTENVRVALALVARGESPIGIVYASDAVATEGVRVIFEFPQSSHDPILYPANIVTGAHEAAHGFLAHLTKSQDIFVTYGFGRP